MSYGERSVDHHPLYKTPRWQRLREKVLRDQHHVCAWRERRPETCRLQAVEVDHIIRHQGDRSLFYDRSNLQGLCKSCHAAKTHDEVFRKRHGADEKGMPLDPNHPWNRED